MEIEEEEKEQEDEKEAETEDEEEGQPARPLSQPKLHHRRLVEEHELTHIPYRCWCVHCRCGRGVAMAHRKQERKRELMEQKRRMRSTTHS